VRIAGILLGLGGRGGMNRSELDNEYPHEVSAS
jgi:hypothetical protein